MRELWGQISASPTLALLGGIDVLLLLAFFATLRTVAKHGVDSQGAFTSHCGISYYVGGGPNDVVTHACRPAFASHALAAVIVLFLVTAVSVLLARMILTDGATPGQGANDNARRALGS